MIQDIRIIGTPTDYRIQNPCNTSTQKSKYHTNRAPIMMSIKGYICCSGKLSQPQSKRSIFEPPKGAFTSGTQYTECKKILQCDSKRIQ